MIRLVLAALLAIGVHATLYWIKIPWFQPHLMLRQSQTVSFDLVSLHKPIEKTVPPSPQAVQPKPKPEPLPKSKPEPKPKPKSSLKTVVQALPAPARRLPPDPPLEPMIEQPLDADIWAQEVELAPDAAANGEISAAAGAERQPAVQASVPRYDLNPPPHYPRVAKRRKYTGIVTLDVWVTAAGRVAQVRIADSSGYAILDKSAAKSVKDWKFTPARRRGLPVGMWVQVPVRFELR